MQIAIIGGGVGGLTSAIYALRAGCQVTIFEQYGYGGITATLTDIENYPGVPKANGFDLTQQMLQQAKELGAKTIRKKVVSVVEKDNHFVISTTKDQHVADAVVVASGTRRNNLGFEQPFVGKGVSYCATCDGNFYSGQVVAVAGSGAHAVNEALYLANLARKVYLVADKPLKADQLLLDKLENASNVEVLADSNVVEVNGQDKLQQIKVMCNGNLKDLDVDGLFVAVGASPQTEFLPDTVAKEKGYLVVDATMQTTHKGIFACGDVTNGNLKQIVSACSDGAKAGWYSAKYVKMKK